MPAKITRQGTAEAWIRDVPVFVARDALTRAGSTLAKAAKKRMKQADKVVTGSISNSITVTPAFKKGDAWVVRVGPTHPAAKYVIQGRRKGGKMPPIQTILDWMDARGIAATNPPKGKRVMDMQQSVAWAIARSIARDGIPAFPFMSLAFKEIKTQLRDQIKEDVRRGLRKR